MNDTPAQVPSNEGKMGVTLEFSSDSPLRAPSKNTTKASATESMTDETLVSNMVVLQYDMRNEEGQLVGVQYVDGVSQSGSNVQVSVSLEPLRKTRVVVLANMTGYFDSESVALGSSLEELNRLTFPIASTDGTGIPNDYNTALPMRAESGDITLTEGQVDRLNLTLYRLVAKVIFQFYNNCEDTEADKYFSLTSITLKNVPKMGSYERVTETNYVDEQFPVREANNFTSYSLVAGEKYGVSGKTCTWYMAPNNGGTSTENSDKIHKMDPTRVPSNFCTYVEIAGTIYITGTAHPVTYRLYLGGSNPNDYNIWANESIQVYFAIKSLPDNPDETPSSNFDGFRISMRSSEMHSMSVTGWALGIQDVRVEPDPTTIPHTGRDYTITLEGSESWGDPIPVRIWDGSEAVAQGRVAYDQYQEGGSITFLIPENKNKVTRSMSFQFQWDGTWITFANGTQFSTALESIGVTPDPLNIPYQGETYTITFNGLWGDDIPVRLWNITTQSEIASDAVSYNGDHSIDLKVPENTTHDVYTIDFQYQWEGVWASIRTGAQYPKAYVTSASVSPAGTIPAVGATYNVTLNGLWSGMAEVRAWDGSSELASSTVACTLNGNSGSGTTSLKVQPNTASGAKERTVTFQYRLSGDDWTDIEQRQQKSNEITAATVSPDPSRGFSGSPTTFTVTLTGVWQGSVPVRAIEESSSNALVSGNATASGTGVQLLVPMNRSTTPRTVIFQYQWDGEWVEIASGVQQEQPFYIDNATVSPDPTSFSASTTEFTVTLTGAWESPVPVRAIINGSENALANGSVTTSGAGVNLTVPTNGYPNPARTIVFQYQWEGAWVEIDRGTQQASNPYYQSISIDISSTWTGNVTWYQAIDYCRNMSYGWRLPSQNEATFMYCLSPSFTGTLAFPSSELWSSTQDDSRGTNYAWVVNFGSGYSSSANKPYTYSARCVKNRGNSFSYPRISTATGGVVVILREGNGGIDEANLFPTRKTKTATGDHGSTDNRMSRKFRVQKTNPGQMGWYNAVFYCDNLTEEGYSDWRLPSQRELMLLWALGANNNVTIGNKNDTGGLGDNPAQAISSSYLYNQSGFTPFANDIYWSATKHTDYSAWYMTFTYGHVNYTYSTSSNYYVRCVRDEE